jgi:hypothetical protein
LPNQILQETIPGSIRTAEHFMMVSNLERWLIIYTASYSLCAD